MKSKFMRIKPQFLLGLAVLASTIMPATSALAMLPMGSEIFQAESMAIISTDETALTVDEAISRENSLTIENERMIAFSDKSKLSGLISKGRWLIGLEEHKTNIPSD